MIWGVPYIRGYYLVYRLCNTHDIIDISQSGIVLLLPVEPKGCFKESLFP